MKACGIFRVVQVCDEERSYEMTGLEAGDFQPTGSGKSAHFELLNGSTGSLRHSELGPED
jgi:hypothetical protein